MRNFADRLLDAIDAKKNPSIIGLDSDFSKLPAALRKGHEREGDPFDAAAACMLAFNERIIDAIADVVPAVKLQSAFYEQYGPAGVRAFIETSEYAKKKGLIVVGDVKRGDIGSTSAAYASAYLGKSVLFDGTESAFGLDCITVNPYLGSDGVKPFVDEARNTGNGIFVLVKTSNPSSSEIQDLTCGARKVCEKVAELVHSWGRDAIGGRGYSSVGAVVGATYPEDARKLRRIMPHAIFLVPGYGSQGGGAKDVLPCFDDDGSGAIVNSSRDVIFAYQKSGKDSRFAEEARAAAIRMKDDITKALLEDGKKPW
jgi:orotidine-5'-phosphate decarboxylase